MTNVLSCSCFSNKAGTFKTFYSHYFFYLQNLNNIIKLFGAQNVTHYMQKISIHVFKEYLKHLLDFCMAPYHLRNVFKNIYTVRCIIFFGFLHCYCYEIFIIQSFFFKYLSIF